MRTRFLTIVAVAMLCIVGGSPSARGDPGVPAGTLDPTFGAGGTVVTHFRYDVLNAIAMQPDGKLVVVGYYRELGALRWEQLDFVVARYNHDGSLDTTFGEAGVVFTNLTGSNSGDVATAVAVLPDGRILVAGTCDLRRIPDDADTDFALVRYLPDGTLDTTFGTNGCVLTDFAGARDEVRGLVVQSDGKIVLAGIAFVDGHSDAALARYLPDGSLDAAFGVAGKVLADIGDGDNGAEAVALQGDGLILIAGGVPEGAERASADFVLGRYLPDGTLDTTFGSAGWVSTDFLGGADCAKGLAIQDDGRILAVGVAQRDFDTTDPAVARYMPNGALDRSFSRDGRLDLPSPLAGDGAKVVLVQPDGRILVGCGVSNWDAACDFSIARVNPIGTLDLTFGTDGWVTTDYSAREDWLNALALTADGRIMAAGTTFAPDEVSDFALACYTNDLETAPRIGFVSPLNSPGLYVWGHNFSDKARLLVDGHKLKTRNDRRHPSEILYASPFTMPGPGESVTLRVRNHDGRLSNEYSITRP